MTKRIGAGTTTTGRGIRLLLAVLLALVIGAPGFPLVGSVSTAGAQERPRTIMDMLFGTPSVRRRPMRDANPPRRRIENPRAKPRQNKAQRSVKSRSAKPSRGGAGEAALAGTAAAAVAADIETAESNGPVEKSATAKTALVVGDFLAGSLAGGLVDALAADPGIRIENVADGSSGLVRVDHLDWIDKIGPLIEEKKPAVILVMVGSNDRQQIESGSMTLLPGTSEWTAEYTKRANALAAAIGAKNVPLVWVGMPSFKFDRMSADMASFNEIYRKASGSVGGDYVDVWDGFVDANGLFSYSGPDIAGQQARLRNEDGITMTSEGAEKLAFFAQKPLLRLLGPAVTTGSAAPGDIAAAHAIARPANATTAPLVGLNDPALDGGDSLLGGSSPTLASAEPSPRQRLVVSGEPLATPIGRADNFNWSGKTEAVAPLRGTDDVISRGSVELHQLTKPQGLKPPSPMPSLADAIIDDWEAQNAAKAEPVPSKPAGAPVAEQRRTPTAAAPAGSAPSPSPPKPAAVPVSASPFAKDQKPI